MIIIIINLKCLEYIQMGMKWCQAELRNDNYMWCVLIVEDDLYYSQSFLWIGFRDNDYTKLFTIIHTWQMTSEQLKYLVHGCCNISFYPSNEGKWDNYSVCSVLWENGNSETTSQVVIQANLMTHLSHLQAKIYNIFMRCKKCRFISMWNWKRF